jgi:hypothetical protein
MQTDELSRNDTSPPGAGPTAIRPNELIAYRVTNWPNMPLVAAGRERQWMDDSQRRFAYRCLPLLIANQAGWWVLNSHPIRVVWTGGWDPTCVKIQSLDNSATVPASGHFGEGVLTFNMPYLFRTAPGYNLHVRGPANLPKDGIQALEGIVETDWTMATFTMNWKFTRTHTPIVFEKGEPICMLTPVQRGMLESLEPKVRDLRENPDLEQGFQTWSKARTGFIQASRLPHTPEFKEGWQKHYFRGVHLEGGVAPEHQSKLELKPFDDRGPALFPPLPDVKAHPDCLEGLALLGAGKVDVAYSMQQITFHAFQYLHLYASSAHGSVVGALMCRALFPTLAREVPLERVAQKWDELRHAPFDGLANEAAVAAFAKSCAEASADPNVKAAWHKLWDQQLGNVLPSPEVVPLRTSEPSNGDAGEGPGR